MAEVDHGSRAHATWSASSTAANVACPGRLSLTAGSVDKESREAAWGTCAHMIGEMCLRDGQDALSFTGRTLKTKSHEFEVDEEMAETAQVYVDYVRSRAAEMDPFSELMIEQRFSLAAIDPPIEAGGTCDAVVPLLPAKNLEVIDLKGGRGVVVEAKGNVQLRTYALGALLANPGLDVDTITVTIVQPRASHADGRIRSETMHVYDLLEWAGTLLEAMGKSKTASDARAKMDFALWADTFLRAGDHCKFCPAAGTCPALAAESLEAAGAWFTPEGAVEITPSDPKTMDAERVAGILDKADMLEDWLNAVRARGQWLAESGVEVPGYQLVDKQARRKWRDEDAVRKLLDDRDVDRARFMSPKILSPAQMQKSLLKADFEALADLIDKSSSGQNLVASAKTTRPAAQSPAAKFLQPIA